MNEYQNYLIQEFADEYEEGHMTRRQLLRRAVLIMGSVPAGLSALAAVGCGGDDDEEEATIAANTPETPTLAATAAATAAGSATASNSSTAQIIDAKFKGPGSDLIAYIAKPAGTGPFPGIVIIHENRGLNDHTKDIARRYAAEGYAGMAVDLVSRGGGTKPDASANTGILGSAVIADLIADMKAFVDYLDAQEYVKKGGVGVTGFCFGGGYTFDTAVESTKVKAAVPYYGTCRQKDKLATTQAAILVMYGALDTRITGEAEAVKASLAKNPRPSEVKIYEGASHAFFNDTGGAYNKAAAEDAWTKTLAWFKQYV